MRILIKTNYPILQVPRGLDHGWLTLHISVSHHLPDPSLYLLTESCHSRHLPGLRHSTSKTEAILLLLPKRFLSFSSLSWCPTSSVTDLPSYTSHCYRQLSPLWCFTPNQIIKQILTRHPEWFTNPPHSYQYAPGSAITSLGLDCCYKPPSGLADSCHDPKICPPPWAWTNGRWRKAVCENTGMWHQPPCWER